MPAKNKNTFLVTGAGGFIGGWLVETLYLQGSPDVRAGIRSWHSAARLARFPVNIVPCDIMDTSQVSNAMAGATIIIHCAVGSKDVIVKGTENMLDVAYDQGVSHFIHLSTTEVYGDASGEIVESSPYQYRGDDYGDAKIEAEKLVWAYSKKGLPITIIRPSIVYGPFSKDWTVRLASRLQSGNWGLFDGEGDGFCNLIYINDLVAAVLSAAQKDFAVGEVFNLNGPEIITWNQYFQKLNAALGFSDLRVWGPTRSRIRSGLMEPVRSSAKFMLRHLESPLRKMYQRSRSMRVIMQYAEKCIKTTPQLDELDLYNRRAIYITQKARDILGFKPQCYVNFGIQMNVRWLRHLGLVNQ
jgi:nucleoside-diphosphate-sugar epimerase